MHCIPYFSFSSTSLFMRPILLWLLFSSSYFVFAQTADLPTDFLTQNLPVSGRLKLREKLPPNTVAVFFSSPTRNRSNDVDFEFHQAPDFYSLPGYKEPNSL